jgi:N-acetyl-alpha-D-muramate 1-phosphate uridylyltransferase
VTTPAPAGIVLAAGAGARLRPLTELRPKALCPVGGRPLLDWALDRLTPLTGAGSSQLAVNAHHQVEQLQAKVGDRALVNVERGEALGTAGAVAALLPWLDGRPALVTNADSYLPAGLPGFTDGWDGERCRLLCLPTSGRPDFTDEDGSGWRYVGACLLPWARIRTLTVTPTGLYEVLWQADAAAGALDLFGLSVSSVAIDCGTPADYLAANLHASGGRNVIGAGATVLGRLERSVVWDGAWVGPDESLTETIRAGDRRRPVTVAAH